MRTALSAPTFCSSCTKYVFTDLPKPDHMVCRPVIAALALDGHQCAAAGAVAELGVVG